MLEHIWQLSVINGPIPKIFLGVTCLAIAGLSVVDVVAPTRRHHMEPTPQSTLPTTTATIADRSRTLIAACAGAVLGGIIGFGSTWLLDHFLVFGVMLGMDVVIVAGWSIALVGALIGIACVTHRTRRALAILATVIAIISTSIQINKVYGEYPTVGSVFDITSFAPLQLSKIGKPTYTPEQWLTFAQQREIHVTPKHGLVGSVSIPNTRSHFKARTAVVYVPPAALAPRAVRLPVLIMMAGQPGNPDRAFLAGKLQQMAQSYADAHHGLAPVIVSPDQLGSALHNTLCVDSTKYGNVETYLTQDVTHWITHNLPVSTQPSQWAIAGFSQGGTCAVQLGLRYPNLYKYIVSSSAELGPHNGSEKHMINTFFNGDADAYRAHVPLDVLKKAQRNHTLVGSQLIMGAGTLDAESISNAQRITAAAARAGIHAARITVSGTGHDWHTVQATLETALPTVCAYMGLVGNVDTVPSLRETARSTGVVVEEVQ